MFEREIRQYLDIKANSGKLVIFFLSLSLFLEGERHIWEYKYFQALKWSVRNMFEREDIADANKNPWEGLRIAPVAQ